MINWIGHLSHQLIISFTQERKNYCAEASAEPETEPETFVAVKGVENEKLQAEMAPDMVAVSQRAMVLEKLMGQPKWAINYIELTFGILILIALILTVFIKIKIQHPKLIANGAMLLTIIAITIVVNQFLSLYESQIL